MDAAGSQSPQSEYRGWDGVEELTVLLFSGVSPPKKKIKPLPRSAGDPRRGRAHRGHQGRAEFPLSLHGRGGEAAWAGELRPSRSPVPRWEVGGVCSRVLLSRGSFPALER